MARTRIGQLVKDIQYETDFTIDQIAKEIGYRRQSLSEYCKKGDSQRCYDLLVQRFEKFLKPDLRRVVEELLARNKELTDALIHLAKNQEAIVSSLRKKP